MMIVQLCCFFFHHLLCLLHCIMAVEFWPRLVCLLLRMLINEKIFNLARTRRPLVDSKARSEFPVCSHLYRIQHEHGKILAVVADDIVGRPLFPHIVDYHFP